MKWRRPASSPKSAEAGKRRRRFRPPLSKVLTTLIMLAAIKLGVLLFMGLDTMLPDPAPRTVGSGETASTKKASTSHVFTASIMGPDKAMAQTAEKKEPKAKESAKSKSAKAKKGGKKLPSIMDWEELNRREEELARREQALKKMEEDLNKRLAELNALEKELSDAIKQADTTKDKKLKHLISVYGNMKAKKAAKVLETLDEEIAVKILAGMKGRQAGEILTNVSAKKAAALSERLTSLQLPGAGDEIPELLEEPQ